MRAETKYAKAGDVHIGYQTIGSGPDLVFVPNWFSNIELYWQDPQMRAWFERLTSFSRLIVFDQRGTGVSDPVAISDLIMLEERAADIEAVFDAAGSERATVFAATMAAPLACYFAATNADRCAALVVLDGFVHRATPEEREESAPFITDLASSWGTTEYGSERAELDPRTLEWLGYYRRMSMGPGAAEAMFRASLDLDVSDVLPAIHVPTLVLHHPDSNAVEQSHAQAMIDGIDAAQVVEMPGTSSSWLAPDQDAILDEVEAFVTGKRPTRTPDERVLATVLFTDIVASTELVAGIGDEAWRRLVAEHDTIAAHDDRTLPREGGEQGR